MQWRSHAETQGALRGDDTDVQPTVHPLRGRKQERALHGARLGIDRALDRRSLPAAQGVTRRAGRPGLGRHGELLFRRPDVPGARGEPEVRERVELLAEGRDQRLPQTRDVGPGPFSLVLLRLRRRQPGGPRGVDGLRRIDARLECGNEVRRRLERAGENHRWNGRRVLHEATDERALRGRLVASVSLRCVAAHDDLVFRRFVK
jgi:hypothetical protein